MSAKAEIFMGKYKITKSDPLYAFFQYLEEKDLDYEDRTRFIEKSVETIKASSEEISEVLRYSKLNIKARFLGIGALGLVVGLILGGLVTYGVIYFSNPALSLNAISFRDSIEGPILYVEKKAILSMKNTQEEVEVRMRSN